MIIVFFVFRFVFLYFVNYILNWIKRYCKNQANTIIDLHSVFILWHMTITGMFQYFFSFSSSATDKKKCVQYREMMDYLFNSWQQTLDWISSYPILFSTSLHFIRHFYYNFFVIAFFMFTLVQYREFFLCFFFNFSFFFFHFFQVQSISFIVLQWIFSGTFAVKIDDEKTQTKWKHKYYRDPKGAPFLA